ncbi:E3 ubiquitin-protein ligase TRIM11-like [Rana temporaria]|uniref:E3 ubiquitin-protein ligase TRIM11-like n=1 Tax=Rana temporaria TaxID=8407 RepID=UPI001AAE06AC|nr:E3 ubiquitin-protein ligase TRIM11-like [Rana temporaria]
MASSDLRAELDCPVCLNIYTDPIMLRCGHNFCRVCIDRALDTQEGSGCYSCPQCRRKFRERPPLQRNITLRNITQHFLSAPPPDPEPSISCTYCINFSVPAVKSCLHCEASLCVDHLNVHSKSPEHVLRVPTSTPGNRKCPVHKKTLEYYCTEDSAFICVSCIITGKHRGHQLETLEEAFIEKKEKLINNLEKLIAKRGRTEDRVRILQEHKARVQGKVDGISQRFIFLFRRHLKRLLEDLEKEVLSDLYRQADLIFNPVNDRIQQLEVRMEEVSRKIDHLEELCTMSDPLTVLQEPDLGDLFDMEDGDDDEEDRERRDNLLIDGGDLVGVSRMVSTGLSDIVTSIILGIYIQEAVDILLDKDTAHNGVCILHDKKTATRSATPHVRPDTEGRFMKYHQVLGSQSFSSGRQFWEVDVHGSSRWRIGVCYASIARDGDNSLVGCNDVSWGLYRRGEDYVAIHDTDEIELPDNTLGNKVRVYLDYEAGQISFYTCAPLRHLHTFTATFTEPLYPVLCVEEGSVKM